MGTSGLQRLQRLSAAHSAPPEGYPSRAAPPARNRKHSGFRLRPRLLFLPLFALIVLYVCVSAPGLNDYLPHTKSVNMHNMQDTVISLMTTMKHLPDRVLHPHGPRKMAVTHTLTSGLHEPFLELGLPKAKKAGVLAATARINVTAAVAQAKKEMAAAIGRAGDGESGGGDVQGDGDGDAASGGDVQPATTVTGQDTAATDPGAAAVESILANSGSSSRIIIDNVATTTVDNAVLPTTTNTVQDAADVTNAAATIQELQKELKQDGGDPAAGTVTISVDGSGGKVAQMTDQEIDALLQEVLPQQQGGNGGGGVTGGGGGGGCTPGCGRHGACVDGRCVCSALQSGPDCKTGASLSWPLLPDAQAPAVGSFEGRFILSKADDISGPLVAPGSSPPEVLADAATMELVKQQLPDTDAFLQAPVHLTCAVVGSSGRLRQWRLGDVIDSHELVFRFNSAPTEGVKQHVGGKTTHRITNTGNWAFRESNLETVLVPCSSDAVQGVLWEQQQHAAPQPTQLLHPEFITYASSLVPNAQPTTGLLGVLLALHRCHNVTLFGFTLGNAPQGDPEPPYHYYDACDTSANPTSDVQQAQLLRALAVGGLLHIGEPCWQQCTGGDVAGCAQCRSGSPVWVVDPTYPAAEDCNPAGASAGHNALPWRAGGVA